MKLIEKHKYFNEKEISFCNIPLVHYGEKKEAGSLEKYIDVFPKSFLHQFLDSIIEYAGDEYDYYFLVRTAGIGEAYLLNFMYESLKEKYNFKNACIVSHREMYKDMYKVFLPDVPCYITKDGIKPYNVYLRDRFIKYKNKTFQVVHSTLIESDKLFKNYVKGYDVPYPTVIREMATADRFVNNLPKFTDEEKRVIDLVPNLNLDKFVFFIPEANNVKLLSAYFWHSLAKKFRDKGYDVYVNTKNGACSYGVSAEITVSQALYLAQFAKGIVSIRAGLLELLSSFDNPKHIIYGEHVWHPLPACELMKTSTLLNYPMVNKDTIFEYDPDKKNEDEIIEEIMKGF